MKTYKICEDGSGEFARVEAASAAEALTIAEREYPRRPSDYNLEPGETDTIVWRAFALDDLDDREMAEVSIG